MKVGQLAYRTEIDGLRAVAVLPVIAFHAGFDLLPGGFVGVDVFFVISGFLISSILISQLDAGNFSVVDFYERRARRILPVLFLVIVATIPFAWLLLFPSDYLAFARSVIGVAIFSSNILFWRESGYFDVSSEFKPLLHTWSLAVEEQFYLVFPLFLWWVWRFGRVAVFSMLGVVSVLSLLVSELGASRGSAAAFFLLPSRFWELSAGALLAVYFTSSRFRPLNRGASELIGWLGLGMIFWSMLMHRPSDVFPGINAVVPVLGAVMVIFAASSTNSVGRFLSLSPVVGVGLISYSLYLWHQPVFALARNFSMGVLSDSLRLSLIVVVFCLSFLSWKYVELPFREKRVYWSRGRLRVFGGSLVFGLILIVFSLQFNNKSSFEGSLTKQQVELTRYLSYRDSPEFLTGYRLGSCYYGLEDSFSTFDAGRCLKLIEGKKNYLVLGDSHAAHLWMAIAEEYSTANVLQANASNCRPIIDPDSSARCRDLMNFILNDYLGRVHLDGLILSARWVDSDISRLSAFIDRIAGQVGKIIVVGPTIEYTKPLPVFLLRNQSQSVEPRLDVSGFADRAVFDRSVRMRDYLLGKGVEYIDLTAFMCSGNRCLVQTPEGVPMSWDYGHYTISGARFLVSELRRSGLIRLH